MTVAIHLVVNRPTQRFLDAIRRVQRGDQTAIVQVDTGDEFGLLANHFNDMMARLRTFNEELQARVKQATAMCCPGFSCRSCSSGRSSTATSAGPAPGS